ncbi:DNA-binding protein [Pseudomonas sp. W22_MBD1_FP4]|uniref:DNA-binding protein n=1 Tax=Pseudomonas sp. W22_MBD1_FP4 TaxID=3240272 RepID=UPI003F9E3277
MKEFLVGFEMRPVEVTEKQIVDAGNQLVGEGRAVTANALRGKIGAGNPRRLIAVWERLSGSRLNITQECLQPQSIAPDAAGRIKDASRAAVNSSVRDLEFQLAETRRLLECERQRVAQLEITVNAVTDQLNEYKQRCVSYETSAKHTQTRIADLTARIDEQRGELHRGSQARHSLEQALNQLQSSYNAPK